MLDINSFTTSDYNKFTSEILEMKTEEKGWVDKSNVANLIKISDWHAKLETLATKTELNPQQDKL